jgi:hypothetical protein
MANFDSDEDGTATRGCTTDNKALRNQRHRCHHHHQDQSNHEGTHLESRLRFAIEVVAIDVLSLSVLRMTRSSRSCVRFPSDRHRDLTTVIKKMKQKTCVLMLRYLYRHCYFS